MTEINISSKNIIVSVVVPVYNASKYLKECLDSLLNQTYKEFEAIIINDGSTDNSEEIINSYKSIDNFTYINTGNKGVSETRKSGIKLAKGKYIAFLDCDDIYKDNFLFEMVSAMEKDNLDLAECAYTEFSKKTAFDNLLYKKDFKISSSSDFYNKITKKEILKGNHSVNMWNKIYKKELIDKYVYDFGIDLLEDYLFNMLYFKGVSKYAYISKPLYRYRITENSVSRTYKSKVVDALVYVQKIKEKEFSNLQSKSDKQFYESWFTNYLHSIIKQIFKFEKNDNKREKYIKELVENNYIHSFLQKSKRDLLANAIYHKDIKKIMLIGKNYLFLLKFSNK